MKKIGVNPTNSRRKWEPAYPPRYYKHRGVSWGCVAVPALFLGVCAALFLFVYWAGERGLGTLLGLGLVGLLGFGLVMGILGSYRAVRIFPYYDQRLPGADTYLSGRFLARNCLRLDALAEARGLKSISGFGFNDALCGEPILWHDAGEGLATIAGLIEAVRETPGATDDDDAVLAELEKIRHAFHLAQRQGVRFGFLLEIGNSTSAQVWEIRRGHIG